MLEFGTAWLVWITEVPMYYLLMSGVAQKKCPTSVNLLISSVLATIMAGVNVLNHNNGILTRYIAELSTALMHLLWL